MVHTTHDIELSHGSVKSVGTTLYKEIANFTIIWLLSKADLCFELHVLANKLNKLFLVILL